MLLPRSSVSIQCHDSGTGEHGVGTGKRDYLVTELGEGTVALMRTIKETLDPHNLFNPGKVSNSECRVNRESDAAGSDTAVS